MSGVILILWIQVAGFHVLGVIMVVNGLCVCARQWTGHLSRMDFDTVGYKAAKIMVLFLSILFYLQQCEL